MGKLDKPLKADGPRARFVAVIWRLRQLDPAGPETAGSETAGSETAGPAPGETGSGWLPCGTAPVLTRCWVKRTKKSNHQKETNPLAGIK
jgi:hypothetical protein